MTICKPECFRAALAATLLFLLAGCAGTAPPATVGSADASTAAEDTAGSTASRAIEAGAAAEPLAADTPTTTVRGNRFVAPEGWTLRVRGTATILEAPEGDSWIALVDVAPALAAKLAPRYSNPALGEIGVLRPRGAEGSTIFDFGEWQSPMATRENEDGTVSFVTTAPGISGFEFVVGGEGDERTLVVRDAQHEYVFEER